MPTILVVDDEPDILHAVQRMLERALPSTTVLSAVSVRDALQKVSSHDVDLVISDYRMPEMNGVEFLKECRRRRPEMAQLLMTAFPAEATRSLHGELDVPVASKPIVIDDFLGMVQAVLDGLRSRRLDRGGESPSRRPSAASRGPVPQV